MISPAPDVSHASAAAAKLFETYFTVKSAHDLDRWINCFAAEAIYGDATLGALYLDRDAFRAAMGYFVPNWGAGRSYPTRLLGDETSAIAVFTNTPELFGNEIRSMSPVDFVDGKVVRFVDYWDSRAFGTGDAAAFRASHDKFPTVFGEDAVATNAAPAMVDQVRHLSEALAAADTQGAAKLFSDDAIFEDVTLRTQIIGRRAISRYLQRGASGLPYAQAVDIAHVVGSSSGGGYEWLAPAAQVRRGVVALELDDEHAITRLTAVWDGARIDDQHIAAATALSAEPSR